MVRNIFLIDFIATMKFDCSFSVYTTFLDDLRRPLVPFGVLKEMNSDFREIPVTNTKILAKTEK